MSTSSLKERVKAEERAGTGREGANGEDIIEKQSKCMDLSYIFSCF